MTKKKDSVTPNDYFYEELKPSLKKLSQHYKNSEVWRDIILKHLDKAIEANNDFPDVKEVFIELKQSFLSLEVAK